MKRPSLLLPCALLIVGLLNLLSVLDSVNTAAQQPDRSQFNRRIAKDMLRPLLDIAAITMPYSETSPG
ncbi:hypothetical protein CIG19_04030 [Enterobacterales bacterium CwR94]|nr:hypothetical protein CIG19_04030 [Enterobacterales bacterium CwR94]